MYLLKCFCSPLAEGQRCRRGELCLPEILLANKAHLVARSIPFCFIRSDSPLGSGCRGGGRGAEQLSAGLACRGEGEEAIRKRGAELNVGVHESRNQWCLCPGMRVPRRESFPLGMANETQAKSILESSPVKLYYKANT